jgi:25S rRNA (uracil2634-N3)-methyltransferase
VDAGALDKAKELKSSRFDSIVFNFPHVGECVHGRMCFRGPVTFRYSTFLLPGSGEKDQERNVRLNQTLLLRFLRASAPLLAGPSSNSLDSPDKNRKRKRGYDQGDDDGEISTSSEPDEKMTATSRSETSGRPGSILITLRTSSPYSFWVSVMHTRLVRAPY